MDIRLTAQAATDDTVTAISSKSYVHRLLIVSALCEETVVVESNIVSRDMEATVRSLCALGSDVRIEGAPGASFCRFLMAPAGGESRKRGVAVDCGESGSTARFLLPLAALFADEVTVTGSGKLPERPMGPLCEVLRQAGVTVSADNLPITMTGMPQSGNYRIAGNVSSQFISGLLFMLPLLSGDSNLEIDGCLESAAYVDMTLDVLSRFGITTEKKDSGFFIPGDQKYSVSGGCSGECVTVRAEGDWSNAAYIMAIGALGCGKIFDKLTVTGLNPGSIQGDRAVVDIFSDFGITIDMIPSADGRTASYVVKSGPFRPVDTDCSQIPDLVPALAIVAAFADGVSSFRNIGRLRIKESDRVESVRQMLEALGIKVDITSDASGENMIVYGRKDRIADPVTIRSFNDHRIAMAAAAASAASDAPVIIEDALAVNKSYPGFFDVIKNTGLAGEQIG